MDENIIIINFGNGTGLKHVIHTRAHTPTHTRSRARTHARTQGLVVGNNTAASCYR